MDTVIGVMLRPLTALVLFGAAFLVARQILGAMPEGRLKGLLSRRYEVVPDTVSPRTQMVAAIILTALGTWIVCVQVLKALGRLS